MKGEIILQFEELKTFIAVADFKNFTRAAEHLNMSQPTVSLHIKHLEEELHTALFMRANKAFHITPAGELLYKRATQLLQLAAQTKEEILWQHKEVIGVLRIAASYTIGESVLPEIIVHLNNKHPNLHFEISIENTLGVERAVRELRCDIGLIEGTIKSHELAIQPFMEDELILVAASQHTLANKQNVNKEDLLHAHWVMREKGSGTREYTDYLHQAIGHVKPSRTIISSNEGVKQIVLNGLGIAAVSIHTVKDELKQGRLIKLDTNIIPQTRTFSVLSSPLISNQQNVKVFLQELNLL